MKPIAAATFTVFILSLTPPIGSAATSSDRPFSCDFINKNAYNNEGNCIFSDRQHTAVMITPYRKISSKKAAEWIVSASIALQIGGENRFDSITVATSPNFDGEFVEAKSSESKSILQDPATIRSLTQICKPHAGWTDVIGPDGKSETQPTCRKLK